MHLATIQSPLGNNVFQLRKLRGEEALSKLFQFEIDLQYTGKPIKPDDIIGKPMTVVLVLADGSKRYFNGIVSQFSCVKATDQAIYRAILSPTFWLLRFCSNCRIFQKKSVKDIVKEVLDGHGVRCNMNNLSGTYLPLEYCVQYRETDFEFVTRLLQDAGIFYFFKQSQNDHELTFADSTQIYTSCLDNLRTFGSTETTYAQLYTWEVGYHFYTGQWSLNDHDFTSPDKKLIATTKTLHPLGKNDQYEIYDYPGGYQTTTDGTKRTTIRIEQEETQAIVGTGTSSHPEMTLCGKITFDSKHFLLEKGKSYVLTSLIHNIALDEKTPDYLIYHNTFQCIPATTRFRPIYHSNKPRAPGVQLATVVGPSGKDIYTDQYGRLKVQFVWDRLGKSNEKSSCWMRAVVQWEGLLRIGTPVIVGFIDDDIDQPIVLGPLHNANLMPLYALEDEQTKSALKRRNIKKAEEKTYNEIRFEDKADKQELYLYASKDMHAVIENNYVQEVKKGTYLLKVKGDITIQTEGNFLLDAKKAIAIKAGDDIEIKAGKNLTLNAGMAVKIKAGTQLTQEATEISHKANAKLTSKAPMQNVEADGVLTLKGGLIKEN